MSVYNESPSFVKQSIESIINQSFTDFEFLIYNDNPKDEILETLVLSYVEKDHRICYWRNNENIGLAATLNCGIKAAKGEYLARMDADDISSVDRFIKQVSFLDSNIDVSVVGSWVRIIDEYNNVKKKVCLKTDSSEIFLHAIYGSPLIHPSVMIRRSYFEEKEILYDESFLCTQDYDLWSRILFEEDGKIANIALFLLDYRISKQQISYKKAALQKENELIIRRRNVSSFLQKKLLKLPECISGEDIKYLYLNRHKFMNAEVESGLYTNIIFMYFVSIKRRDKMILLLKKFNKMRFSFKQIVIILLTVFFPKKFVYYSLNIK